MPIEAKEILEYLNIPDVDKFEDLRSKFESDYIKKSLIKDDKEIVSSIVGKVAGSTQSAALRELKARGIEVSSEDFKGLALEKVAELSISKVEDLYKAQLEEAKKNAGGGDAALKTWEEKYSKLESKLNDTKSLLEASKKQWETDSQAWQQKEKDIKRQTKLTDVFKGIKWKTDVKEIEKKGFFATINEKYKDDLDENGELFMTDATGQRIKHPKKNGEWKSPLEILEEEGRAQGIWATNPVAERGTPRQHTTQTLQQPAFTGALKRPLSEKALANEGKR